MLNMGFACFSAFRGALSIVIVVHGSLHPNMSPRFQSGRNYYIIKLVEQNRNIEKFWEILRNFVGKGGLSWEETLSKKILFHIEEIGLWKRKKLIFCAPASQVPFCCVILVETFLVVMAWMQFK